jgi:uncharacterized protein YecE (DUF72 family)
MKPAIHIGTSGWNYAHWKGLFYDGHQPRNKWLEFYAHRFSTVEVNATFYHLPRPETIEHWINNTPDGFIWSVKASRYITHVKKLRDPQSPLERFYGIAEKFGNKLGPILFQLPPSLRYNEAVLSEFCNYLRTGLRYVFEVRHPDWLKEEALVQLKEHGIAFCISDTAGRFPSAEAITADFIYIRLHGSQVLYGSEYTEGELVTWAEKIRNWKRETFVYFDNDAFAYAPKNAQRLKEILGS